MVATEHDGRGAAAPMPHGLAAGLALLRERQTEIWPCGSGVWRVPAAFGNTVYLVWQDRDGVIRCGCGEADGTCAHGWAALAADALYQADRELVAERGRS